MTEASSAPERREASSEPEAHPADTARSATWGRAMTTAAVATLSRPALWPLALASFLVRGGIVLFALPIVVVPTPTGISNVFAPYVAEMALGGPTPGVIRLLSIACMLFVTWLVTSGIIGAALDVEIVRALGDDEDVGAILGVRRADGRSPEAASAGRGRMAARRHAVRILVARLIAHAPLVLAVVFAVPRIVGATYHELVLPEELATSIVVRVVRDVPDALALVLAAWLAGETLGALAARAIVFDERSVLGALSVAVGSVVTHPLGTLLTAFLGLALTVIAGAPGLVASAVIWSQLTDALSVEANLLVVVGGTLLLVGAWLGALVLAAAISSWRAASWTLEAHRARPRRLGRLTQRVHAEPGRA